jgi:hypothetical protein
MEKTVFDEEKFKAMIDEVMSLPPLTGNILKDYNTILLKELAVIGGVWKEYHDAGTANALIDNHIEQITTMYGTLLTGIEDFVNKTKEKDKSAPSEADTPNEEESTEKPAEEG